MRKTLIALVMACFAGPVMAQTPALQTVNSGTTTAALVGDACQLNAHTFTPISQPTATTTKWITGTAAKKTYICHIFLFAGGADNVAVVEGSGSTCGTSTLGLLGGATAATGLLLAANQGWVEGTGPYAVAATTVNANDVCIITSAAQQLSGVIVSVQQ